MLRTTTNIKTKKNPFIKESFSSFFLLSLLFIYWTRILLNYVVARLQEYSEWKLVFSLLSIEWNRVIIAKKIRNSMDAYDKQKKINS